MLMAKIDKEYEARMQGMIYACNLAEKEGLDALKKEIQMRGITKIHLGVSQKEIGGLVETIAENLYTTFLTMTMIALEDAYGFKKTRLMRFKKAFDKQTIATYDMDWLGKHYISIPEYARYLRDECGIDLSNDFIEVATRCQRATDNGNLSYKKVQLERLIEELEVSGHVKAAEWLLKRFKDGEL
jgi:hypothetical protein